jgi:DNA-binding CsgD family transcriptional regulator
LIWDSSIGGANRRVRHFLDRAAHHGIGSGLALYFVENHYSVLVALNRRARTLTADDRAAIDSRLGDTFHFGYVFHWMYMKRIIANGIAPLQEGFPLSPRERECLGYAAKGMTSSDISHKLGIAERTVNFHFSNVISKLGVLNRNEAIATAVAKGMVSVSSNGNARKSAYFAAKPRRSGRRAR